MTAKNQLPQIKHRKQVAKSRLFAIEQLELTFANGEQRVYERMQGSARGAVMVVPLIDQQTVILVKEYLDLTSKIHQIKIINIKG